MTLTYTLACRISLETETREIEGYLCTTTITTIDYLVSKKYNKDIARTAIQKLLIIFQIAEVNKNIILHSVDSKFTDFEDAVQHFSGQSIPVDSIVTRNISDFKQAEYPVYSPSELLGIIELN